MFIISGEKGSGKTKALLEKAKAEDGIIVCEDAVQLRNRAYGYRLTGLDIASYDDLLEGKLETSEKPIYIHDINKFIIDHFPYVKGYTVCSK